MNLPLQTERLILRDFVESDWQAVHEYAGDREVVRYLTFGPNSEEDTKNFLQREISLQGQEPRQHFALAVTLKDQQQLIGICRISTLDTVNKTGSIGYSFTLEHHNIFGIDIFYLDIHIGFTQVVREA